MVETRRQSGRLSALPLSEDPWVNFLEMDLEEGDSVNENSTSDSDSDWGGPSREFQLISLLTLSPRILTCSHAAILGKAGNSPGKRGEAPGKRRNVGKTKSEPSRLMTMPLDILFEVSLEKFNPPTYY
jgi:hypothetical protein